MAKEVQKEIWDNAGLIKIRFYVLRNSKVVMLDTRIGGPTPYKRYPSNEQAVKALVFREKYGYFPESK